MSDLVQRLRSDWPFGDRTELCNEAADEIERQRADAERYRWLRNEGNPYALLVVGKYHATDVRPYYDADLDAAIDAARAALKEPMHCPKDGGECGAGGYCRPEQRKPLTDEKIKALVLETVYEGDSRTPHRDAWSAEIGIPFARAVERAHGITGEST